MSEGDTNLSTEFAAWQKNRVTKLVSEVFSKADVTAADFREGSQYKYSGLREGLINLALEVEGRSQKDRLTGRFNYTGFDNLLTMLADTNEWLVVPEEKVKTSGKEYENRRDGEQGRSYVVVVLDEKDLRIVNNTQGHSKGNEILQKTGEILTRIPEENALEILQTQTRQKDVLAFRWGGDEWVAFLNTTLEGAVNWWKRVNKDFLENGINISAGVAVLDRKNPRGSFDNADALMYKAKAKHEKKGNRMAFHVENCTIYI